MQYERKDSKLWAREALTGYMVSPTTPFRPDGSIDEEGLRENIEYYVGLQAVESIYCGSLYQEPFSLTGAERRRVHEVVVEVVDGRVPVMVSASTNSVDESVALAQHAQTIGADLVMLWPPQYGHRTREGVLDFLQSVARQVDIGLCMYATRLADMGFYVDAGMLEILAKEDNVCAVKEASMDAGTYLDTLERVGESLSVSCPLEEYWILGRQMLSDKYTSNCLIGTSRALYLETPERTYLSDFFRAAQSRDFDAVGAALYEILKVSGALHGRYISRGEHNISIVKAVMELQGRKAGGVRPR